MKCMNTILHSVFFLGIFSTILYGTENNLSEQKKIIEWRLDETLVRLPCSSVIEEHLKQNELRYFAEHSGIAKSLDKKELYPLGIVLAVELAFVDYIEYLKKHGANEAIVQREKYHFELVNRCKIVRCILYDNPEIFHDLQKLGWIKKIEKK